MYDPKEDKARLLNQLSRVRGLMLDGKWRTLREIADATGGDPEASVSAQLRHLRKKRFGSYVVEKRSRGERKIGLYEYRVLQPTSGAPGKNGWAPTKPISFRLAGEMEFLYNTYSALGTTPSDDFFQLTLWLQKRGS